MDIVSYRGPRVAGGVSSGIQRVFDSQSAGVARWFFLSDKVCLNTLLSGTEEPSLLTLLPEDVVDGHYRFCNEFLWPVMHDLPAMARLSFDDYQDYLTLNKFLAAFISYENCNVPLFVQDYQLAALPPLLADSRNIETKVFWHIPWPKMVPVRYRNVIRHIATTLLSASQLGFHTKEYASNFLAFVLDNMPEYSTDFGQMRVNRCDRSELLSLWKSEELEAHSLQCNDLDLRRSSQKRRVLGTEILVQPLGIDLDYWTKAADSKPDLLLDVVEDLSRLPLVLSVDRVDYTKAVFDRLEIIDRFFCKYPEWVGKIRFVQICSKSREGLPAFDKYYENCVRLFCEVNQRWSNDSNWQPIVWLKEGVSPSQLAHLYKIASVMLVNPVRDGLNLTAEEFAACQSLDDPGVLLLSPGAGAWAELHQSALPAHPDRKEDTCDALQKAITMPLAERKNRMERIKKQIGKNSPIKWWDRFEAASADPKRLRKAI